MSSRRDTPKNYSPKSPPNSPNNEPATNDEDLKGIYINYYAAKVSKSLNVIAHFGHARDENFFYLILNFRNIRGLNCNFVYSDDMSNTT